MKQKIGQRLELNGKRFGKLIVISLDHTCGAKNATYWKCKCDCGNERVIKGCYLTAGTKSCGCLISKIGTNHKGFKGTGEISASLWNRIKSGAERRELEFTISIDYAWNLFLKQNRKCALTDKPLELFTVIHRKIQGTASLDRIDSSKGYVEGNVQWLHKDVNMLKSNYDQTYFIELCKLVASKN
jgi:hypothetical protein